MKCVSILLATLISKAAAAPSGAGACPAGEAAPGGPHLTGTPGLVGPLSSEGSFVMTVGGVEVSDGEEINTALDFDITVTATATGTGFKGILIRVGGATADQLTSGDLTAPAGACVDVGSATHSDASVKTTGTASVSLDTDSMLDVDISVVVENSGGASTFYYSAFKINAVAGDIVATSPPFAAPSVESKVPTTFSSAPVIVDPVDATVPPTTMAPVTAVPIDATVPPTTVTVAPSTAAPIMGTIPPRTMAPSNESDPPSLASDSPSLFSDPPSTVPDGMPSVVPNPSSLVPGGTPSLVPAANPTSDALIHAGAAAAFTGAFLTLFA